MKFEGKTAVITGAASGIGAATAKRFAEEGANVVVNYHTMPDKANALVAEIEAAGGIAVAIYADVTKSADVQEMMKASYDRFGSLDILVNSAGVWDQSMKMLDMPEETYRHVLEVNMVGIFNTCKAAIPLMLKDGGTGNIVNIGSAAGLLPGGGGVAYTSSKHGVVGLTREICFQYAHEGIRANAVLPGLVDTDMVQAITSNPDLMEAVKANPSARAAQPIEIANAVLYVTSDEADFIQGQTLTIDGGWFIRH